MTRRHRHRHGARDAVGHVESWLHNQLGGDDGDDAGNSPRDKVDGDGRATVVRTVYQTLEPTFDGPVAGYSTLNEDPDPDPTTVPSPTKTPGPKPNTTSKAKQNSAVPTAIRQPLSVSVPETILAKATGDPALSTTEGLAGQLSSTPTPGPNPTATSVSDPSTATDTGDGASAGAKAGIAFGILGGVLIVGLIAFVLFTRRRGKADVSGEQGHDEKHRAKNDGNPLETVTVQSDPPAPRISLRPVTQFLPNWNLDKRTSRGVNAASAPGPAVGASGQRAGSRERPATSQSMHPANPFGSEAERVLEPPIEEENTAAPPSDPFTANGPVIGAATAAGSLTRKASMRKEGSKHLDLTVPRTLGPTPPSPAGTEFSMTSVSPGSTVPQTSSAAAVAAAGGPPNSAVHRVQLDFKPSLDDEMEMKAGDLVRLLHEYDDGWALVIRLDRSQQGVVPRTCLSTRPVKPRASPGGPRTGPPVNPSGQRPMTPQGMPQGASQNGGPGAHGPRPSSRQSGRPRSPEEGCNGPAKSPGSRPQGAAGPPSGAVGRKPVPGLAY
ncbi:uncharacterized protein UV8b_06825 [Ustilaginoidea virens]|uniref:SH3 domain-containing protein n=1 Tax=Ustilaginoidea virens TaxID=1159556 RepID=A0A1B5L046_USTVR|nr:uncharacterized protein UV8b_06825 [Ustilaginoidea virens]QUC22584.1 hypothetical protein UV8b_06825 [Ustilaginoidea virens]GAO16745.1 hypothetical protein UVI_02058060 [Ustilaginoidea virens]